MEKIDKFGTLQYECIVLFLPLILYLIGGEILLILLNNLKSGGRLCNFSLPLSLFLNSRQLSIFFFDIVVTIKTKKTTDVNFEKVELEVKVKIYLILKM